MTDDPLLDQVWPELLRRGIVAPVAPQRLGHGNADRRSEDKKLLYLVTLRDGAHAKLTIGRDLRDLTARSQAWANAFPDLACQPLSNFQGEGWSALVESYFDGASLEETVRDATLPPALVHQAFTRTVSALEKTRRVSTPAARANEWESWADSVSSLAIWNPAESAFLKDELLPALARHLLRNEPQVQWVHGDFIDRNLLLNPAGDACLIDTEFAQLTHFFPAEVSRFHALSSAAHEQPGVFAAVWPLPSPSWDLFFWLTQVAREATGNSPDYLAKWLPERLGTICRLGETILGEHRPWPWTTMVASTSTLPLCATAELSMARRTDSKEEQPLRLNYRRDRPQTLFFRLAESSAPWRIDVGTRSTPTTIRRLAYHTARHALLGEFAGSELHALAITPLGDTQIKYQRDGVSLTAPFNNPQVTLPAELTQKEAQWLEIEFAANDRPKAFPADLFQIEERRWTDQPSSISASIAGWCVSPDDSQLVRVEAVTGGKLIASSEMKARPDVQQHHNGKHSALLSGFLLDIPAVKPRDFIELIAITNSGRRLPLEIIQAGDLSNRGTILGDFPTWANRYDPDPPATENRNVFSTRFSILLPVFNPPLEFLRACLGSVRQQQFEQWELCVVDDASTANGVVDLLERFAREDTRIRLHRRATNGGIATATNDALGMATGDYIVMLDHDDVLRPHALLELARELNEQPALDVIYSDEDKISSDGARIIPFLKPAYSPEYLLSVMYPGHLLCVRRTVAQTVGGFDSAYDGVQDYEFFLRLTERTHRIGHLPRILYHWRQSPGSSALDGNVKGDMDRKQIAAVRAHLQRRKDPRSVISLGRHRLELRAGSSEERRTAILLAWSNGMSRSGVCDWSGLLAGAKTIYAIPSVVIPSPIQADYSITQLSDDDWSTALQRLAGSGVADVFIVFTSPPVVVSDGGMSELAGLAARADSGCVAPLLISREDTVFESGRTYSRGGSHPIMCGFEPGRDGYNGSLACTREVSAISPICFAVRAELLTTNLGTSLESWITVFDELRTRGLFNRVCPHVRVQLPLSWRQAFAPGHTVKTPDSDPFFNVHFDPVAADYSLAAPPLNYGKNPQRFLWYLDTPLDTTLPDGCLTLRGWCFRVDRSKIAARIEVAGITWSVACDQPRPDVSSIYGDPGIQACGFIVNLRLPAGDHVLELRAVAPDGAGQRMLRQRIKIPTTAVFRRWLRPAGENLGTFQLMPAPSTPARPIEPESFPSRSGKPTDSPHFAIVTPSFQQGKFLAETMRSVIDQPQVHVDYIVQDGGSTDGSVEIIKHHVPHLAAWESAPDHGQADAIVRGFSKCRGKPDDIMAWINSDDFYLPGALPYVARYFASHPDVDVVYGNRILIDDQSREIGRWFLPAHDDEVLKLNDFVPQETMFWRRRIWDKVGGIDPSLKFAMDWDLLLRFQAAGAKIVRVPYFLACFRIHSAQKTSAQMESIGQKEIDALRVRTFGRMLPPNEIETHPRLLRYLRKSAWIEFLWRRLRIRHP